MSLTFNVFALFWFGLHTVLFQPARTFLGQRGKAGGAGGRRGGRPAAPRARIGRGEAGGCEPRRAWALCHDGGGELAMVSAGLYRP